MSAGWTVEGVLLCPACTLYIDFEGSPAELREAIAEHECRTEEGLCRAHPDDCPNGPEPHAYYNPPEFEGRMCCCRQPGEPETPPGELLEELF